MRPPYKYVAVITDCNNNYENGFLTLKDFHDNFKGYCQCSIPILYAKLYEIGTNKLIEQWKFDKNKKKLVRYK